MQIVPADIAVETVEALLASHPESDWLLQVPLRQHEAVARLNPTSVNTFRVLTWRHREAVHVLSTFVRVGRSGSVVDNVSAGGFGVALADDGSLAERGYTITGTSATHHPDHGYAFGETNVPAPTAIHDVCRAAHEQIPGLDLLAWDLALSESGVPTILEVNVGWIDINIHQFCTGPVFGPWTDEALRPRRVAMLGRWLA